MMKRVTIRTGTIGLVFRNGNYREFLTVGKYWVAWFDEVKSYSLAQRFVPPIALNLLLRDQALASQFTLVEVSDVEIAFQFEEGHFKTILSAGRYAFWQGVVNYKFVKVDLNKPEITEVLPALLKRPELIPYVQVIRVPQYYKSILYYDGKFKTVLDAGVYYFWKGVVEVTAKTTSMQLIQVEANGQEMLTKDKAALRVNFIAQYQISDIKKALEENYDVQKQLYTLIQLALRTCIGTMTLDELLDNKQNIGDEVLSEVQPQAIALGI